MNERGFVMIGYLLLLPLLITIVALSTAAYLLFKNDGASRHQCRLELLRTQTKIASDLHRLLDMNNQARQLRARRAEAEAHVLETAGTPAMALAEVELNAIIAQQLAFSAKQKALLAHARLLSRTGPMNAELRVQPTVERTRAPSRQLLDFSASHRGGAFAVMASPASSLTPDYEPASDFSQRQEMHLGWSFSMERFLPDWLKQSLPTSGLKASAQCTATIEKEKGQWKAKLTVGKSSSNCSLSRPSCWRFFGSPARSPRKPTTCKHRCAFLQKPISESEAA